MARYLVTGGAGFIGSHLVDRLIKNDNEVTVYDNLVSGKKENIQHQFGKKGFTFIEGDIMNVTDLKKVVQGQDIVWHLAANTDIPQGNRVTDLDLKNCTVGTHNVLEVMRLTGVKNIIFASSACVFGDAPMAILDDTYGPLLPINLYGAGKLACEGFISAYSNLFGIKARIYRFGNVVGGRMGHGVIYDFIQKLKKNPAELEILGDGHQEKNFFLVEDCIEGMRCGFENSEKPCDIFTLGSDHSTIVTRIAEIVTEEMGLKDVKFNYTGGRSGWAGDAPIVLFNISKMKTLGWAPSKDSDGAVRTAARRILGKE